MTARATIDDVARLAGVARSTVSRVCNGSGYVSPASRARVEDAVRVLGYRARAAARSLRTGADVRLGIVIDDPTDSFVAGAIRGAAEAAEASGVTLLLSIVGRDGALPEAVGDSDGCLVVLAAGGGAGCAPDTERAPVPLVVVASDDRSSDAARVVQRAAALGRDAAQGLIARLSGVG